MSKTISSSLSKKGTIQQGTSEHGGRRSLQTMQQIESMGIPQHHCPKEGWASQMAVRLPKVEYINSEKALSTTKDTRHHAQKSEVHLLHKDRPLHDVPLLYAIAKKPRDLCDLH